MKNWKEKYGEWALITGASSGIGEAFARRLGKMGMNLILVARRKEKLEKLSDEIKSETNIDILIIKQDLTEKEAVENITSIAGDREVGILINNAGFGSTGEFDSHNAQQDNNMILLSCAVPTELTHYFLKPMRERKKGGIIFLGSVVGFMPVPYMSVYSAVKAFNHFLGSALWYELKEFNIDVLSLNPGTTDTEFQKVAGMNGSPLQRSAEDVVETAVKSLGKKPAVVDGIINKFYTSISKLFPGKVLTRVAGRSANYLSSKK